MKNNKVYIVVAIVIGILFLIVISYVSKKKIIDWGPSFINTDTNPYGTYINYKLLSNVFDGRIVSSRTTIYNNTKPVVRKYYDYSDYTDSDYAEDSNDENINGIITDSVLMSIYGDIVIPDTTAYLFINESFTLEKVDLEYFLDFVGIGNNVFISAENFSPLLLDTLKIKHKIDYYNSYSDSLVILTDYKEKSYDFQNVYSRTTFNADSCKLPVRVLATDSKLDTMFIQVKYGNGYFYLHTVPVAFANINQLDLQKYDFAYRCLSYLPRNSNILWDEYQKQGAVGETSMFRVMLSHPALRLSLWIIALGFLLFMIFRAKRIQRIIPIIKPPVNSSVEFLDTISNLYYRKKDYKTIADKRYLFFLDYVRKRYYMSTEHIDDEFIRNLSAKSGMDTTQLQELFIVYKEINRDVDVSNTVFLRFNRLLEDFYKNARNS